jgi:CRP/FNR family transcriptional regulator, cyclic AMP receptor protein
MVGRGVSTPAESLSVVPLFANLNTRQLRKLARSATEDRYEAGDVILREGGHTDTLFVVLEGTAKVVRNGRTVARRSAGEFFGEISMIDARPRTASVVADSSLRCLVLHHDSLRRLVMDDPQMAWSLLTTLAGHVRGD